MLVDAEVVELRPHCSPHSHVGTTRDESNHPDRLLTVDVDQDHRVRGRIVPVDRMLNHCPAVHDPALRYRLPRQISRSAPSATRTRQMHARIANAAGEDSEFTDSSSGEEAGSRRISDYGFKRVPSR